MKFNIERETIIKPLLKVSSVVERRQTLPILSNILVKIEQNKLSLTATDLEVELVVETTHDASEAGEVTLPARKFLDICKTLPDNAAIDVTVESGKAVIRSGKSRFTVATLPANEFPSIEKIQAPKEFSVTQGELKTLIGLTQFAMAQQDVRYYLNGLLLEVTENGIKTVATDGHRLAMSQGVLSGYNEGSVQVIIPRKGVLELAKILENDEALVNVQIGSNIIRVKTEGLIFSSKLIDGRFPDYDKVVPKNGDKTVIADRISLIQTFTRTSILSNEKYRGIRIQLDSNRLKALAHNPDQEEAEEEISVEYNGPGLEIGFNVNYLIDALHAVNSESVKLTFSDANSSCLIQPTNEQQATYVVMPMRL